MLFTNYTAYCDIEHIFIYVFINIRSLQLPCIRSSFI